MVGNSSEVSDNKRALAVACPRCHAAPQIVCDYSEDLIVGTAFHAERIELAKTAAASGMKVILPSDEQLRDTILNDRELF